MSDLSELTSAIEASNRSFEEFKKANDQRIEELKKGTGVPADVLAKIDAITKDFGEQKKLIEVMEAKMKRPQFGGERASAPYYFNGLELKGYIDTEVQQAHRKGFDAYIRKNRGTNELFDLEVKAWGAMLGLPDSEIKAMNISSGPDGGFAVPKVIDAMIEATLVNVSPIRGLATVVQISTPDYHKLVNIHGTASGWVGEKAARAATATPTLEDINPPMGEIYAFPQATQTMLDDVFFNAESWLADEITLEFARAEGVATRARLTWISPNKGVYLFTNPLSPTAAVSISPEALAEQMRLGEARIIDDASLVDRAVDTMLADLKEAQG